MSEGRRWKRLLAVLGLVAVQLVVVLALLAYQRAFGPITLRGIYFGVWRMVWTVLVLWLAGAAVVIGTRAACKRVRGRRSSGEPRDETPTRDEAADPGTRRR